jgi:intracellular multiplication protein IcmE
MKQAGFTADQLKKAGYTAKALKDAGYTAKQLADAGYSDQALKAAGFSAKELAQAGVDSSGINSGLLGLDNVSKPKPVGTDTTNNKLGDNISSAQKNSQTGLNKPNDVLAGIENAAQGNKDKVLSQIQKNNQQLQKLLQQQQSRLNSQRYQQKIQREASAMSGAAQKALSTWTQAPSQSYTYIGENEPTEAKAEQEARKQAAAAASKSRQQDVAVKAGDIMYAVLDTSVNSDEKGPVLATVVTGRFKGGKLIGSFSTSSNGEKLILTFNRVSLKNVNKTVSINAVAIDPDTARTAMASRTDNHYLLRYGSLFASSFLQGFGNAFQSAGTTITVGGTNGNVAVSQGVGRSILENAVIGLAQVGTQWSTQARQIFNTPPTVELYAGTGIGILFTQDINSIG